VQLMSGMSEFWYGHVKPAWLLLDAETARNGPLSERPAGDPGMQSLMMDLRLLEPMAEPHNFADLKKFSTDVRERVQLVHWLPPAGL
jgi:hypothetical protein